MFFASYTFDELLIRISRVLKNADESSPRNKKTKELLNVNLELKFPCRCILVNRVRKQNHIYIEKEIEWYLSGEKSTKNIKDHASLWEKVADENGDANSAYGWQIFSQIIGENDLTQIKYVLNALKEDKLTRTAIINIHQNIHKYNTKDIPCTLTLQFLIRHDNLYCIVNMRSTDLIYGLCNDIPFFSFLMEYLRHKLLNDFSNLKLGSLFLNSGSLHVYEKHFKLLDQLSDIDDEESYLSNCLFKTFKRSSFIKSLEEKKILTCCSELHVLEKSNIQNNFYILNEDPNIYPVI